VTGETLARQLVSTRQVLEDLLQEKLPHIYVVQSEGVESHILAVCLSLEKAKSFVETRAGRELEWKHGNSHGNVWWPARDAAGIITEHEVFCG
jgi:hypothetical protein